MSNRPSPDQQIRCGVRLIGSVGLAGLDPETRKRLVSSVVGYFLDDGGMAELEDGDAELLWETAIHDRRRRLGLRDMTDKFGGRPVKEDPNGR